MNPRLRNTWHVVLIACLAWLSAVATGAASRPATPQELKVFDDAAADLRAAGLPVPPFAVVVTGPVAEECGAPADTALSAVPVACAQPGTVYVSPTTAADLRRWWRHTRHKDPAGRRASYRRCGFTCPDVLNTALHELVHVYRMSIRPWDTWLERDLFFEEGIADTIAFDRTSVVVRKVTGLRDTFSVDWMVYPGPSAAVRAAHPTRVDRLAAARVPDRPTLLGDVNS